VPSVLKATNRIFCGKKFLCLDDPSAPDADVAAIEKRICNQIISDRCSFVCGVDAFAGVGVSAFLWARCSRTLFLVERRQNALTLLRKNLRNIRQPLCTIKIVHATAQEFLEAAVRAKLSFDFLDLDPFGDCLDLLPVASALVQSGVICFTTGEMYQVYRGLNRRGSKPTPQSYRGKGAREWVRKELLPEITAGLPGSQIVHFYAYPTSVRVIVRVGCYPIYPHWFEGRPRFLSWLA